METRFRRSRTLDGLRAFFVRGMSNLRELKPVKHSDGITRLPVRQSNKTTRNEHSRRKLQLQANLTSNNRSQPSKKRNVLLLPDCFDPLKVLELTGKHSMGEVDVMSDAKNIKKLLKIPYNKSAVSMMVHRVGNTLLLDEFDIHTHLLRAAENEWGWLKKFYLEHIFASCRAKQKASDKKSSRHSRDYLQQQNLFISKFLYHSIALNESENTDTQVQDRNHQVQKRVTFTMHALPQFSKNIIWTFEDLRMLIGTDMPIFGGGTHPCLSLRLRDMSKPINVLTGLNYWLDNLMSKDDEIVVLYDLTSLCNDLNEDINQNPFTTPVAMLLFNASVDVAALSTPQQVQAEEENEPQNEWKQQYWRLLMEKCRLAYVTLADEARKTSPSNPEKSLSHLRMAAFLWAYLEPPGLPRKFATWKRVGRELFPIYPTSLHKALQFSLEQYRLALASFVPLESGSASHVLSLAKRLGNVANEMGVFMSKASAVMEEGGAEWKRKFVELFQVSQQHLEEGTFVFRKIKDNVNVALLSCNLAKLHRIQARTQASTEEKEASLAEWKCYSKA
ncbi:hypothetical protein DAPPUDRAFT_104540 [Daphnia pulex]|uniref:Uncharacterized protein n=1 Tax=Daphnia pulex TaxID=6669 RepID=E9GMK3_DAPPU|nr:hypothetical protein DAPPUDRAFT_104540 [Daphnia pulex]|eukprot:EFX79280.1 hypothetical protein DAPPUDRAFT_104540 [Daphnia pulex]